MNLYRLEVSPSQVTYKTASAASNPRPNPYMTQQLWERMLVQAAVDMYGKSTP